MTSKTLGLMAGLTALLMVGACTHGGSEPETTSDTTAQTTTQPTQEVNEATTEYLADNIGNEVFFDFDESDLRATGRTVLNQVANWMTDNPGVTLMIEGHADERGTRSYNLALGARRASSVKDYLVSRGIQEGRLNTSSEGEEDPVCAQSTESCYQRNRRALMTVSSATTS